MNRTLAPWGATKAQSYKADNPRALLFQLAADNPQASREELLDLCLAEIEAHPEYIESIVEYWFINNYRSYAHTAPRLPSREMIDSIKAQICLLDFMLPTGKTLGQSTGTECVKLGGWLTEIGERAGKQIVASVFSEQQLRDLLAEHA